MLEHRAVLGFGAGVVARPQEHRALWEAALPAYVASGELYLMAYDATMAVGGGTVVRKRFDDYDNLLPSRAIAPESKLALLAQYESVWSDSQHSPAARFERLQDRLRRILVCAFDQIPRVPNIAALIHSAAFPPSDVAMLSGRWEELAPECVHPQPWWDPQ